MSSPVVREAFQRVVDLARTGRPYRVVYMAAREALVLLAAGPRRLPRWVRPGVLVKETVAPFRTYPVVSREYDRKLRGYHVVVELPARAGGYRRHNIFFDSYRRGIFPWRRVGRVPTLYRRRAE